MNQVRFNNGYMYCQLHFTHWKITIGLELLHNNYHHSFKLIDQTRVQTKLNRQIHVEEVKQSTSQLQIVRHK